MSETHAPASGRARMSRSARRAQLLAAAREVFGAHGYHAATLEEIAEEAGFSRGVVYSRFKTKADLFLAMLEERIGLLRDHPKLGRRLRKRGRRIHVWTVNTPADLDLCVSTGVEAVITDDPRAALDHLDRA